ncbi:LolA family protein [Rosettibacter firmus]|uniref:LolA family protein n=1 Tax=Rosettibacter firmus TaxID=3111522 RepID=UPI00336BE240
MKIILFIFLFTSLYAQSKDATRILNELKQKFEQINDYEVDAEIKFNLNTIKIHDSKVKIFYKKPDKFKIKSDSFVMLPKQGINFHTIFLNQKNFTSIYMHTDKNKIDVIKVIPISDTSDIILATLWIDNSKKVINKIETVSKRGGTFLIELFYDYNLFLPSSVKFIFGQSTSSENNQNKNFERRNLREPPSGNIIINYKNYKINKNLPDEIFDNQKSSD